MVPSILTKSPELVKWSFQGIVVRGEYAQGRGPFRVWAGLPYGLQPSNGIGYANAQNEEPMTFM